jgi:hypothetical protein
MAALCALAVALILGQSLSAFAEHAGLLPCVHQCDHSHDTSSTGKDAGPCDAACHGSFVLAHADSPARAFAGVSALPASRESAPDSPVREIEYPPQLS